MRRASQKRIGSSATTTVTPPAPEIALGSAIAPDSSIEADDPARRRRYLPSAIRKRIESRLPGRVRDLVVRMYGDRVVLEGECATYYTKQLAQHAALGILEDEHLDNAIVVNVPR